MKTYIVDSFTDTKFKGNPAGVVLVESPLADDLMLKVAKELGLSETAFIQPTPNSDAFPIRYFSPKMEIPLCGHATLAAAKVLCETKGHESIEFITVKGISLPVALEHDRISMRFPIYNTIPAEVPEPLVAALGVPKVENCEFNKETNILLLEIESYEVLSGLSPDFSALLQSHDEINGVLVTAKSNDGFDFHSRYFWPWSGTNEDPVTGGTHTFLAKYWADRLGKMTMRSFQSSERTGFMDVTIDGEEVIISGLAVIVLKGELQV